MNVVVFSTFLKGLDSFLWRVQVLLKSLHQLMTSHPGTANVLGDTLSERVEASPIVSRSETAFTNLYLRVDECLNSLDKPLTRVIDRCCRC